MTYILFIAFYSYGFNTGLSISEFKTSIACEAALKEAKEVWSVKSSSKCMEVKTGSKPVSEDQK